MNKPGIHIGGLVLLLAALFVGVFLWLERDVTTPGDGNTPDEKAERADASATRPDDPLARDDPPPENKPDAKPRDAIAAPPAGEPVAFRPDSWRLRGRIRFESLTELAVSQPRGTVALSRDAEGWTPVETGFSESGDFEVEVAGADFTPGEDWRAAVSVSEPNLGDFLGGGERYRGWPRGMTAEFSKIPEVQGRDVDFGTLTVEVGYDESRRVAKGRLLTAEGERLAHAHFAIRGFAGGENTCMIRGLTDGDGRFAEWAWLPGGLPESWSLEPGRSLRNAQTVALREEYGHALDFGDIVVQGAVLEIEFHNTGPRPLPNVDWTIALVLPNDLAHLRANPALGVNRAWLRPGRWRYTIFPGTRSLVTETPRDGVIEIEDGKINRFVIEAFEGQSVGVVAHSAHDLRFAQGWEVEFQGEIDHETRTIKRQGSAGPMFVQGRSLKDMKARARAEHYDWSDWIDLPIGEVTTITLDRLMAETAIAKVRMEDQPVNMAWVYADHAASGKRVSDVLRPSMAFVQLRLDEPGLWRLQLFGGMLEGYPDGTLSGPVEIEVEIGGIYEVELTLAGPPREDHPEEIQYDVRCGGSPVLATLDFQYEDGSFARRASVGGERSANPVYRPLAHVRDGERLLDIARTTEGTTLKLSIDLPVRVDVIVTRAGAPVPDITVRAADASQAGTSASTGPDGRVRLWLPPGAGQVSARVGATTARADVVSRHGEVVTVVLDIGSAPVHFVETGEAAGTRYEPNFLNPDGPRPTWRVTRMDGVDPGFATSVSHDMRTELLPGRYRAYPPVLYDADPVDFEVDGPTRVELPTKGLRSTDTRIVLPPPPRNASTPIHIRAMPMTPAASRPSLVGSRVLTPEIGADGMVLTGLQAGVEWVVFARSHLGLQPGAEGCYVIRPFRVTPRQGETVVAGNPWVPAVPMGMDWMDIGQAWVDAGEGALAPLGALGVFPGGVMRFSFGPDEDALAYALTILPGAGESPPVPEDLRRQLIERRLLSR